MATKLDSHNKLALDLALIVCSEEAQERLLTISAVVVIAYYWRKFMLIYSLWIFTYR